MRIGISTPQDFLALLVRRKWWVIFPFIGLTCASVLLASLLPSVYVSEALILVQPRDVPEDFVMDLIGGSSQQRLSTIQQTVLSRTNLLQILREFEADLEQFQGQSMDAKVVKIRDLINISFELDQGELTSFRISFENQNPELAQRITSRLTTLFIEQDNRVRETQVFGTTEFLASELAKTSQLLSVSAERLRAVRSRRRFELPEQLETNLRTLDRLGLQQQSNSEAMDRYATIRLNLELQISETPETLRRVETAPRVAPSRNPLVVRYHEASLAVDLAEARYTPEHPAVKIAKAHLESLEAQIPPEDLLPEPEPIPPTTTTMLPNPVYRNLLAQLEEVKTEFEIREREKKFIEAELQKYSRRVENTPLAEQEIAELLRGNGNLQAEEADLRADLAQARLAESLESRQKGAQFVIIDPANYPLEPSKPNKLFVALWGLFGSLGAAIGFAAAVDILRQRVWTSSEIETFWGAPVLVDIPEILTDSDLAQQQKRKFMFAGSSLGAALMYAVCLYMVYLYHEPIIQQLDPVLQRLVYR